jgi:hypothetical protein
MRFVRAASAAAAIVAVAYGCSSTSGPSPALTREDSIPANAVKVTPQTDVFPPVIHSSEWESPVPMPGPVNTAGVEDAPVISCDGSTFLFFFTPDGNVPAEDQFLDGWTGVWLARQDGRGWTEPERAFLEDPGELALDGPLCLEGDTLWFASFRVGNYLPDGDIWTAVSDGAGWSDWRNAGGALNMTFDVGELWVAADGSFLVCDRTGPTVYGARDLWRLDRTQEGWSTPVNLGGGVNTSGDDTRPCLSFDGMELWYTGASRLGYTGPSVFRSVRVDTTWGPSEEIVSNYSGDPGVDAQGNLYFTHLFYDNQGRKIEADIYVAYRR